jgi:hypothetical protein
MTGSSSCRMPAPVSLTTISTCELTRWSVSWIRPSLGVNLTAFIRRFQTTCCRRSGSPLRGPALGSRRDWSVSPLATAAGRTASSADSSTRWMSTGRMSSRILPLMMRDTSSRSSISWSWTCALRTIASSARGVVPESIWPIWSMRAHP